jgi:hypothetical protein
MAPPTKRKKGRESGETTHHDKVPAGSSFSSFCLRSIPGIVIAIAAALWIRGGKDAMVEIANHPDVSSTQMSSRQLLNPSPGSWTDGFYTTEDVADQPYPSTHARLYPNGGGGEPEFVSFSNDEEFLALGRLYNDLGQIVQSPLHFPNGTDLYRGPVNPGTHFQWPAGEFVFAMNSRLIDRKGFPHSPSRVTSVSSCWL